MKYTLYCIPGRNFRPGVHCLLLGRWLEAKPARLILIHGNIPDQKVQEFIDKKKVAVFKDNRYHTLSVEAGYNPAYMKRIEDIEQSQQFCGYLLQQSWNRNIFVGGLDL